MILKWNGCWFNHYDDIMQQGGDGYAALYVYQKWNESSMENKAKLCVYRTLFEIDLQLGTRSEFQLRQCCCYAVNLDILKVIDIN